MEGIRCTDFYEITWYLLNGAEIDAIEGRLVNKKVVCNTYLSSPDITELQARYFQGRVQVNLFDFRRTYKQVCNIMVAARNKFKKQMEHEKRQAQAASQPGGEA